jgi:outer membrane protein
MSRGLRHAAVVLLTAASLAGSPLYAQEAQNQGQAQALPATTASQTGTAPALDQVRTLKSGPDYSKGPRLLPDFTRPYRPVKMPEPVLTNSPDIGQLIQDGKLMLSLEDAISLALENNLDISVQRFTPWLAQVNLLRTKAGGASLGTSGSAPVLLGSTPSGGFDPILTSSVNFSDQEFPVNNPFISGTGTPSLATLSEHAANYDFGYSQTFHAGTAFSVSWDNDRSSSTAANIFNPSVQSNLYVTLSQPLLRGFGILPNTRYILEAKNSVKVADAQFAQAVIQDVAQVSNDYWELVFARENVKVEESTVGTDEQLYENNKKQLEIGTMAPLDVVTAESQLASDQQALVQAQTTQLQDETVLLNAITKDPLATSLDGVEIIPTTPISTPEVTENIPIQQAVQEAWTKRPEIRQAELNLKNAGIEVRATHNELLPSLTLFGQYGATGLGGILTQNTETPTAFIPNLNAPVLQQNGTPVIVGGMPTFAGTPSAFTTTTQVFPGGLRDALDSMINAKYPSFVAGINFSLPIRNRAAQADNAQAQLDERQQEVEYRQLQNKIFLNVRNALIALVQSRAAVAAAEKARDLAQQSYDAEVKKFQLGSSTSFNVVIKQQQLTSAEGTDLRDRVNLVEAQVNFDEAMGRTLDVNNISMADARAGKVYRVPNIPGAMDAAASEGSEANP